MVDDRVMASFRLIAAARREKSRFGILSDRRRCQSVLREVMVGDSVPVDPKLLEILVCPLTKGPLTYDRIAGELISERAGLAYPIRGGIPIMLIDEARKLDE